MRKLISALIITFALLVGGAQESYAASLTYTVKKGDSLYKIAQKHNISITLIKQWNNMKTDTIHPNQKLIISSSENVEKKSSNSDSTTAARGTDKVVKEFTVSASAFTANCNGCSGKTSTGINLKQNPDLKVIAVDPNVIKLGTKVYVEGYGYAIAGDTGGSIKGNKIDVFFPSQTDAFKWGRKDVVIKILE